MRVSTFVPARDSRHRHACFALYRALVREGRRIPLPSDLLSSNASGPHKGHPIPGLIQKQFRRNKADVSKRLVFVALTAGYKFLSIFREAQSHSSDAHAKIVSLVRPRVEAARRREADAAATPHPPAEPKPKPNYPPLVTRRVDLEGNVTYVPTRRPIPAAQFTGPRRHIPRVFVTAEGIPFLRLKKPQPRILGGVIRNLTQRRVRAVELAEALRHEGLVEAGHEDQWEDLVAREAAREGVADLLDGSELGAEMDRKAGYAGSVRTALAAMAESMQRSRLNAVARTEALVRIADEEKKLWREERARWKEERRKKGRGAKEG
ncbi:hypothetical protein ACRALDRAFT_1074333 [Sodiomyces alcalophilus JCM 7366]|uniref:uncharacterized protein n=1 Tax=Sodiomyces alcalophilus JCM 7366 TaxID=591952 RepID=UPI0039B69885